MSSTQLSIELGDVVISRSSSSPALVIAVDSPYGIVTRRFHFTAAGNFKGQSDAFYRAPQLQLADSQTTQALHHSALRAHQLTRKALPKAVFDLISRRQK